MTATAQIEPERAHKFLVVGFYRTGTPDVYTKRLCSGHRTCEEAQLAADIWIRAAEAWHDRIDRLEALVKVKVMKRGPENEAQLGDPRDYYIHAGVYYNEIEDVARVVVQEFTREK